jgi:hypothetical protein
MERKMCYLVDTVVLTTNASIFAGGLTGLLELVVAAVLLRREEVTKLANGGGDVHYRGTAESQDESGARHFAQIGGRKRPEPKVLASGSLGNFQIAAAPLR